MKFDPKFKELREDNNIITWLVLTVVALLVVFFTLQDGSLLARIDRIFSRPQMLYCPSNVPGTESWFRSDCENVRKDD